jgi:hypothetical protein
MHEFLSVTPAQGLKTSSWDSAVFEPQVWTVALSALAPGIADSARDQDFDWRKRLDFRV